MLQPAAQQVLSILLHVQLIHHCAHILEPISQVDLYGFLCYYGTV